MAVELREARPGDELMVAELHVRSWQEAYGGLMPAEFLAGLDPRDRAGRYTFGSGAAAAPTTLLAVIAEGGDGGDPSLTNSREVRSGSPPSPGEALLGFVTFGGSRDRDAEGLGEVYALYVDPERHRGGVGRMLMTAARRQLVEDGFDEAILWVLQGNERARSFYEREGWKPDGTSRVENVYDIVSTVHRFRRKLDRP
ncbi:MAG TPA: GNAT family N-acetyltransferase [Solirubrobacterales bacterium]|nr:GNAT family N-acetyltransferase [Solirubrobacterales bacterium]